MKIVFKKPNLVEEYLKSLIESYDTKKIDVSSIMSRINDYFKVADSFDVLLNHSDSMPNSMYYLILSDICSITLEKDDYLKIISDVNDKKYNKVMTIKTTMKENKKTSSRVTYESFVSDDAGILKNQILNKKELKESIDNKSIVLIYERHERKDFGKHEFTEKKEDFKLTNYKDFIDKNNYLILYTSKYIRENISKERLKNELSIYLSFLKEEINHIINYSTILNNSVIISKRVEEEINNKEYLKRL